MWIDTSRLLSVGMVASRADVRVSALHFYEREGLLESLRSNGNQRRYARDVLRRIAIIKVAQRIGIPLAEVRQIFASLPNNRTPNAKDWAAIAARWKMLLDQRILMLTRLRNELENCIGCGCLSVEDCNLRNKGDVLGKEGSGARLWLESLEMPRKSAA